uniref:Glycosyltransferase family 1 protein n=1 Tax=candidate division WOR-3 bacterium TaxID=2052148 RepID=A0A7V4E5D4_UNCW3
MKREVLVISTAFPRNEKDVITPWLVKLMEYLEARGFRFTVFTSSYKGIKQKKFKKFNIYRFRYAPTDLEFLTHDTGVYEKLKEGPIYKVLTVLYMLCGLINAIYLSLTKRFDIVHVHWPMPHIIFALPFKIFQNSRVISQFHGSEVGILERFNQIFKKIYTWLINTFSDRVITNSSYNKVRLINLGIDKNVEIIPLSNPHSTELRPYVKKDKIYILFVGRFVEVKGLPVLIRAFAEIVKKYPSAELHLVGDGPQKPELTKIVKELKLDSNVKFQGFLVGEPLLEAYNKATIFVLPSIKTKTGETEGLGVVLIEALSHGVPVIGSKVGGIPDIIIDGKTGLLFEPDNHLELAEKITLLIENPELRKKLVEGGQKHILENFSWEKIVEKMEKVYITLITHP